MPESTQFVTDIYLPELGLGAGFSIWGFRASSSGMANCPCIIKGFTAAFGADATDQINRMIRFSNALGHEGKRKISLSMPGCARVTADELSIIAALSAAQARDGSLRDAHLTWLLSQAPCIELSETVTEIADGFAIYGMQILAPRIEIRVCREKNSSLQMISGGTA